MTYFLSVDVSTTGVKALLIDAIGRVVASASTALTLQTPRPLWSEQNPHDWWNGAAASLKDCFSLLTQAGLGEIGQVHASGGGIKSALWRQIFASVLNTELVTVDTTEGAAYSAALLAGVGAGAWPDVDAACSATIHITGSTAPDGTAAEYQRLYPHYRALYPALKPTYDALAVE
jgi:sugar (pentulose or hexulose) kinase